MWIIKVRVDGFNYWFKKSGDAFYLAGIRDNAAPYETEADAQKEIDHGHFKNSNNKENITIEKA